MSSTPATLTTSVIAAAFGRLGRTILCLTVALPALAANTDLATAPMVTSSPSLVLPNIFVMMDDSGSMDWDFLPDKSNSPYFSTSTFGYASAQCNGVFYDPNITYSPPLYSTGASYPNVSFTAAPIDGFGVFSGTADLSAHFKVGVYDDAGSSSGGGPGYYYKYTGTQTSAYQKNFNNSSSTFFTECNTAATGVSSAFKISTTSGGSGTTGVTSITVNGTNIMSGSAAAANYPGVLGAEIISKVTAAGYSAVCSSGTCSTGTTRTNSVTITILGPSSVAGVYAPVITTSGGTKLTLATPPTFSNPPFTKVVVSATSGPGGTDERQNFANWYSYYRVRINMMKTGLGQAFQTLGANYRVGYATMNNNGGSDMVNPLPFNATQKAAWYSKVYGAQPGGGTGLIQALASVGQMYANLLPGNSLNGVAALDPIQYSCQQNFTILSTDGYWNVPSTDSSLSGGTVGNVDGGTGTATNGGVYNGTTNPTTTTITAPRPYCDGSSTCSGNSSSGSGTSDTLADVAMYYYMNDLRTAALGNCTGALGSDVCTDNVPTNATDTASWHHMTLFTLGLGAPGYMIFDPTYQNETATSPIHDYFDVAQGTLASPTSCTGSTCHCPWYTVGSPTYVNQPAGSAGMPCEWPVPDSSGIPANIDDLWHAAVNGRGLYFNANNPNALAAGLSTALSKVKTILSDSAAATTSSPNVTATSNFVYSSTYTSAIWDGELSERTIDVTTGAYNSAATPLWTAAAQLDAVAYTSRNIYFNKSGVLTPMIWSNLSSTQQGYFTTPNISSLSQFCSTGVSCLTAANQAAASGQTLLNFVRGDRTNEGPTNASYYRVRTHVLGDIVDSQAAFVGPSLYQYADAGYAAFVAANATRAGTVYVGANDGMLHAFNTGNGTPGNGGNELWAFVPSAVMSNLYKLADQAYPNQHQYYVDGSPVTGDAYFGGAWHTILVGGLNDGGQSYYALDVTNPTAPTLLWEFTNANLGYTFGNPVITKLQNGTWVVLVASGYNNTSGDGMGHLFVLNAQTGAILGSNTTATPVGSSSSPSGLARISAWVDHPLTDNTALRAYGGDLFGNLWRFDINGGTAPQLLVTLKDSSNNPQPITTIPELGLVVNKPVVFIGTGQYLGVSDLTNTHQQTVYAIKDTLATSAGAIYSTNPQSTGSNFVQQTLTDGFCPSTSPASICSPGQPVITSSNNPVDFNTNNGWYVNFPNTGERDNTDSTLVLGTLIVNTNVPTTDSCSTGGNSYEYFLNYMTGGPLTAAGTVVAVSQGNVLTASATVYQTPTGQTYTLDCHSDGSCTSSQNPSQSTNLSTKRVGWHEVN